MQPRVIAMLTPIATAMRTRRMKVDGRQIAEPSTARNTDWSTGKRCDFGFVISDLRWNAGVLPAPTQHIDSVRPKRPGTADGVADFVDGSRFVEMRDFDGDIVRFRCIERPVKSSDDLTGLVHLPTPSQAQTHPTTSPTTSGDYRGRRATVAHKASARLVLSSDAIRSTISSSVKTERPVPQRAQYRSPKCV